MNLAEMAGSTITGGVIGMIGSLGSSALDYVNRRQEAKEQLAQLKVKNEHELGMVQVQGRIDETKASYESLNTTVSDQSALNQRADTWVVDVIALFRPGLTTLLVVGAVCAGSYADKSTFNALIELSAMAVAWWFGDRQRMKFQGQ